MKNYKSAYPVNGLFAEEMLFIPLGLNIPPLIDGYHRRDVCVSLMTSFGESLTYFMHELPDLDNQTKEKFKHELVKLVMRYALVSAYEKVKGNGDKSEIMEFFRHVRNAAAHNGCFKINEVPKNKAAWRGKTITIGMHGNSLFGSNFAVADTIILLQDLEEYLSGKTIEREEEPPVLRKHSEFGLMPVDPRHWKFKVESLKLKIIRFLKNF